MPAMFRELLRFASFRCGRHSHICRSTIALIQPACGEGGSWRPTTHSKDFIHFTVTGFIRGSETERHHNFGRSLRTENPKDASTIGFSDGHACIGELEKIAVEV